MSDLLTFSQDRSQWTLLRDLLGSGQVPEDRMADLARANPEFWSWHEAQFKPSVGGKMDEGV